MEKKRIFVLSYPLTPSTPTDNQMNSMTHKLIEHIEITERCETRHLDMFDLNLKASSEDAWEWCDVIILVLSPLLCSIWTGTDNLRESDLQSRTVLQELLSHRMCYMLRTPSEQRNKALYIVNFHNNPEVIENLSVKLGVVFTVVFNIDSIDSENEHLSQLKQILFPELTWV